MTPQENELVAELFDRLAKLETTPRDPDAERLIADGTRRARRTRSTLWSRPRCCKTKRSSAPMRGSKNCRRRSTNRRSPDSGKAAFSTRCARRWAPGGPRGSVPSVRARAPPPPPGYASRGYPSQPGYPPPPGYAGGPAFGTGGSFLGTAASTAAGVIGGSLLLDGIRSMFGHHLGGYQGSAFGNVAGQPASPWSGGAADSQLARDAGINHIGDHTKDPVANTGNDQSAAADDAIDADDDALSDDDDLTDDDFADDDSMSDDSSDG